MRHCGRGSGCTQHYLNYDAKVYNSSLPLLYFTGQTCTYVLSSRKFKVYPVRD